MIDQRTEGRYPARAVKDFNRLAEATQIRLHLEAFQGGTLLPMWNTGPDLRGLLVLELLQVFGIPGAVERLKRCPVCRNGLLMKRGTTRRGAALCLAPLAVGTGADGVGLDTPKADDAGTRDCV